GHIQPYLMGADVGDVGHPRMIGRGYIELLLQEVRGHQAGAPASIAWPELVTRLGSQLLLTHQSRTRVFTAALTHVVQIMGHLAVSIDMSAVLPTMANQGD